MVVVCRRAEHMEPGASGVNPLERGMRRRQDNLAARSQQVSELPQVQFGLDVLDECQGGNGIESLMTGERRLEPVTREMLPGQSDLAAIDVISEIAVRVAGLRELTVAASKVENLSLQVRLSYFYSLADKSSREQPGID